MCDNKQLMILGLSVEETCEPHIRKNLSPGIIYPFYRFFKDFNIQKPTNVVSPLSPYFFSQKKNGPIISFSAIVGKNGSGKSTLIDILLRLLNNISYKLQTESNKAVTFAFVNGVRASVYYSIGMKLYRIKQSLPEVANQEDENIIDNLYIEEWNSETAKWEKCGIHISVFNNEFFYSIFLNYSIHAFNTLDYLEDKTNDKNIKRYWLDSCFHKNDAYTTPLVLNPKRTKGVIDINNENHLAKGRLLSLIFISGDNKKAYTYINSRCSISSIELTFNPDSVKEKYDKELSQFKKKDINHLNFEISEIENAIKELWLEKYQIEEIPNDTISETAIKYIVYKTFSIANTYDEIFTFAYQLGPYLKYSKKRKNWKAIFDNFIDEVARDDSHVTYRLKQTLAFLKFRHYKVNGKAPRRFSVEDLSTIPSKINQENDLSKELDHLVPPPIFDTKIFVKDNISNKEFPFNHLSSGERQLAYAVSTIIYHLRNLNSVPNKFVFDLPRRAKYNYANIVLDEIELYFHPGYQRKFVDHLIKCLELAELKEISGINVMMVTHSPFILSDIPKSNVLFLKDGRPDYSMQENTFACNIHSILQNGFFMEDGTLGEFAKNKVNDLFHTLHNYDLSNKEDDLSGNIRKEILLVSEPILRSQLLRMYNELSGENKSISQLYEMVIRLQTEINLLKK